MKFEVKVLGPLMVAKNCLALFKDILRPKYHYYTTPAPLHKLITCLALGELYYEANDNQ